MEPNYRDDKVRSIQWAQTILAHKPDALIIDTETTGLDDQAQIVQIGVIDLAGNVLLDALVRPSIPIPPAAVAVHHIGDEAVMHALAWPALYRRSTACCAAPTLSPTTPTMTGGCSARPGEPTSCPTSRQTRGIAPCAPTPAFGRLE